MAEGARLESVYRGNSIEGSNPSPSAILRISRLFASLMPPMGRADRAAPAWALGGEFELCLSLRHSVRVKTAVRASLLILPDNSKS